MTKNILLMAYKPQSNIDYHMRERLVSLHIWKDELMHILPGKKGSYCLAVAMERLNICDKRIMQDQNLTMTEKNKLLSVI